MFLLLEPETLPRGLSAARRRRRLRNSSARCCNADCPLPFFRLPVAADRPDWAAVARAARGRLPLLAPPSLAVPPDLAVYDPAPFRARLLLRSAVRLLRAAALPPQKLTLTLCDRAGLLTDAVPALLPLAAGIRILTANSARYAHACIDAMKTHGVALQLREGYTPAAGRELLLLCDGAAVPHARNAVVLADRALPLPGAVCLPPELLLRPLHQALLPAALPAAAFAGALTSCCACPDYRNAVSTAVQGTALETAALQLRRFVTDL